jgi:hypothetical protein
MPVGLPRNRSAAGAALAVALALALVAWQFVAMPCSAPHYAVPPLMVVGQGIPDVVHFVYGMQEQKELSFVAYVAVLSAFVINEPQAIVLHHHFEIYGPWFDALLRDVPMLRLERVELPIRIGAKPIWKTAHRADAVRMDVLRRQGGVYMDMDTISVRPYRGLLNEDMVMGTQEAGALCNAVMLSAPQSLFIRIWASRYEEAFVPGGWGEASIRLPYLLSVEYPSLIRVMGQRVFFWPSYDAVGAIFQDKCREVPQELIALHLWETFSAPFSKDILSWSWASENSNTMYGQLLQAVWDAWSRRPP